VEKVAQPFVDRVVARTRVLRQGPESGGEVDVGSLSAPGQLEIIEEQVRDAVDKGARVLTGGRRNPGFGGYFYEPTVLVDVNHAMAIMHQETFGPTLPIQIVKDEDEAVRLANDSTYRPRASLWTRDQYRARQLAGRIAAARVTVNDVTAAYPIDEGPAGAIRQSRLSAEAGLEGYNHVQSVVLPRFRPRKRTLAYPYRASALRAEQRALRLRYLSPLGKLLGS
jgi:acyl-CoA reductase-like NAD-dependent aldehyde dehydrogenase